jgi:hypothetical protein
MGMPLIVKLFVIRLRELEGCYIFAITNYGGQLGASIKIFMKEIEIETGAKVDCHARYIIYQLAEVAILWVLFSPRLGRIGKLQLIVAATG